MPPRRKRDKKKKGKKGKKGNSSDSSTPHSSTPSVEDEKQQLFKGGACGSSDSRERESEEKHEGGMTASDKQFRYERLGATSSRNRSESDPSSKMDHLPAPDTDRSSRSPKSSPKASFIRRIKNSLSPKKSCKDKKNQPECLETTLEAGSKSQTSESKSKKTNRNESKSPAKNKSHNFTKESENGIQSSSSSSGPSVGISERTSEKRETGARPKIRKHELTKRSQIKSETSSSSGSPVISIKDSGTSTGTDSRNDLLVPGEMTFLEIPEESSSSNSGPSDPKCTCFEKIKDASGSSSDIKSSDKSEGEAETSMAQMGYDPQEGTSRGPVRCEHGQTLRRLDIIGQYNINRVLNIGERDEGSESLNIEPRPRSKSFSRVYNALFSRKPSPRRNNTRRIFRRFRLGIKWDWLNYIRKTRDGGSYDRRDTGRDQPDSFENDLLRDVEADVCHPSVRRHESTSPLRPRKCTCGKGKYEHKFYCPLFMDLRKRRQLRKGNIKEYPKKDKDPENDKDSKRVS